MATSQENLDKVWLEIIQAEPSLASLFPRQARWRWYGPAGALGSNRPASVYFFTTETLKHAGHDRYVSGKYRYIKSRKLWEKTGLRYHAKRKDAHARAASLWQATKRV